MTMVPEVPGGRALRFASRWFDPAMVHRTFEPLVADWQREWYESPPSRRAWVSISAGLAFACAAIMSMPSIVATPTPHLLTRRVAGRVIVFCLIVADLLSIPMVRSLARRSVELPGLATLVLLALPGALMIAFPFSMVIAVDAIQREDGVAAQVKRAAALKLALLAVLFMVALSGFLVPFANQWWLQLSTPAGWNIPEPSALESSTLALLRNPDRTTDIVPGQYTRAGQIRRVLINRTIAGVLPALMVWLGWTTMNQRRRRRYWPLPGVLMAAVVATVWLASSYLGAILEHELEWQPGSGLFVPLAMFVAWTLLAQWLATSGTAQQGDGLWPQHSPGRR